jgi:hypothetical protein
MALLGMVVRGASVNEGMDAGTGVVEHARASVIEGIDAGAGVAEHACPSLEHVPGELGTVTETK